MFILINKQILFYHFHKFILNILKLLTITNYILSIVFFQWCILTLENNYLFRNIDQAISFPLINNFSVMDHADIMDWRGHPVLVYTMMVIIYIYIYILYYNL